MNKKGIKRYITYLFVGFPTFLLDIWLLFLLTDILHIHAVYSAGIAFLIVDSVNYVMCRIFVFPESTRPHHETYIRFIIIALVGVLLIMGLMYLCIDVFHFHYIISRCIIGIISGYFGYIMNLYLNFRLEKESV